MKTPSINSAALKDSLLKHGDKLAFGFAGLCFLMFAYSALSRDKLGTEFQPDKLEDSVKAANRAIDEATGQIIVPPIERPSIALPTELASFKPFKPPVVDPKGKRTEPNLLSVEELRAAAGFGTFAVQSEGEAAPVRGGGGAPGEAAKLPGFHPAAGQQLKSVHWAVITGLVPLARQMAAYDFAFSNADAPSGKIDEVQYISYELQRAAGTEEQWATVDQKQVAEFQTKWPAQMDPVTPGNQNHKLLTMPLGPLVGVDWTESVAHPPEVPFTPPKKAEATLPGRGAGPRVHAPNAPTGSDLAQEKKSPDVLLYRFFDFNVAPGGTYQYRVRLRLTNPNFQLEQRYLKDPRVAAKEFLDTPWSEPVAITVPRDVRIFASAILPPKVNSEIATKLLITTLDEDSGLEYSTEVEGRRGTLLNTRATGTALDPRNGETKQEEKQFTTDTIVLDIYGGGTLDSADRNMNVGGQVLLVDADGRLLVREELLDASIVKSRLPQAAAVTPQDSSNNLDKLLDLTPSSEPATKRRPAGGPLRKR